MYRNRRLLTFVAFMVLMILVTACGNNSNYNGSSEKAGGAKNTKGNTNSEISPITIQIGNTQDPSHPINVALEEMKSEIKENTDGEIILDIYPSAQLGASEFELLDQIVLGNLDAGLLMGGPALVTSSDKRGE